MTIFDAFAVKFFAIFCALFVNSVTSDLNWHAIKAWQPVEIGYEFVAETQSIVSQCKLSPNLKIQFPLIPLGSHEVFLDGQKIFSLNDPKFRFFQSSYSVPIIPCSDVMKGTKLTWKAYSGTKLFGTIFKMPYLTEKVGLYNFFSETVSLVALGGVVFIGLFTLAIFWGKISNQQNLSISFSSLFFAGYFATAVASALRIPGSLLELQRTGIFSLYSGCFLYLNNLRLRGYFDWRLLLVFGLHVLVSFFLMGISHTPDGVEFGVFIPLGFGAFLLIYCVIKDFFRLVKGALSRSDFFHMIGLVLFVGPILNDILLFLRFIDSCPLFSIGMIGGTSFSAFSINEKISQMQNERNQFQQGLYQLQLEQKSLQLEQQRQQFENEKAKELSQIALHAAHDIRSPIAALSVIAPTLLRYADKESIVLKAVIDRISHIADSLLRRYQVAQLSSNSVTTEPLLQLITPILAEKRYQFKNFQNLQILFQSDLLNKILCAKVEFSQFQRLLSNLVNNAIEALPDKQGKIEIDLREEEGQAKIIVKDNGIGMPQYILNSIGFEGATFNKREGFGVGLSHAMSQIKRWGGKMKITSAPEKGTSIAIFLPIAPSPDWLSTKIDLSRGMKICIIDDDPSIFQAWQTRILARVPADFGIQISYVSSLQEFGKFTPSSGIGNDYDLYLVDYEFEQDRQTDTIAVLDKLGLTPKTILVTNHSERQTLRTACSERHIRIIPKDLLSSIQLILKI